MKPNMLHPVEDERHKVLHTQLRDYRLMSRLSQDDLGVMLGLSQAAIYNIEAGRRRLDISELINYLQAMSISLADFFKDYEHRLKEWRVTQGKRRRTNVLNYQERRINGKAK